MKNKIKTTVDRGVSVRRLLSLILAATMTLSLALPALALEDAEVIRIYSAEDLLKLSEKCRLDSWSVGKRVVLEADISLDGITFSPIPTFGEFLMETAISSTVWSCASAQTPPACSECCKPQQWCRTCGFRESWRPEVMLSA